MRIGLVTDFYYPWIGGPSIVVRNLAQGLTLRGHTVHLLAPSASGRPEVQMDGTLEITRVRTFPAPFGYRMRTNIWLTAAAARWLDRVTPDVVHVHHPFPISATAIFLAGRRGIPIVATNHTIPECALWGVRRLGLLYRSAEASFAWWLVRLLERCDRVATPTRTAAHALQVMGYRRDVDTISNGVDTTRFAPGASSAALKDRFELDGRPTVLYTGRLDAEKQMDVWLRAAAAAARQVDVQFVVGGEGTERPRLEQMARDLGIEDRTRFIGYVSDQEFPSLYRMADVFFITSPVELQSITALEALASGLPIVAVEARALPELVHHAYNGYLVAPGDWQAAGSTLADLLLDEQRRSTMGIASREMALEHDLHRTIERYERLLENAIASRQGDNRSCGVPGRAG